MENIIEVLLRSQTLLILPHVSADGDALGSGAGLALGLNKIGKRAFVLLEEPIQRTLSFIPGQENVLVYDSNNPPDMQFDAVISIDLGDESMMGGRARFYSNASTRINIDHHMTNRIDSDISYIDTNASAVGEIVFDLLKRMDILIDGPLAQCLYTAILTDTGGFRYTNTTPRTHIIASELVAAGVDIAWISKQVFDTLTYSKVVLMKRALNNMERYLNNQLIISYLLYEDIKELDAQPDDFEGLVNIGRNLEESEVSLLLRETEPNLFKGSLRSNNYIDVTTVAGLFNGGGHMRAAGFITKGTLHDIREKVLDSIEKLLKNSNHI